MHAPLAAALALAPSAAHGEAPSVAAGHTIYATRLISNDHPAGEVDGTLDVTIGKDGTIVGFYRPVDSAAFYDVVGGVEGRHVYLSIHWDGLDHVTGSYRGEQIVAYTFTNGEIYRFTATPARLETRR